MVLFTATVPQGNWLLVGAVPISDYNLYYFYTIKTIFYHFSLLGLLTNVYN